MSQYPYSVHAKKQLFNCECQYQSHDKHTHRKINNMAEIKTNLAMINRK